MDDEKMLEIAEKIKSKTATEQEVSMFISEYNKLISDMTKELESIIS